MLDIYCLTEDFPAARPSYAAAYKKYMKLLRLEPATNSAGQPIAEKMQEYSFLLRYNAPAWKEKFKEAMDKVLCMLPVPNAEANDLSPEQPEERAPEYNGDAWKIYEDLTEPRLPIKYETETYQYGGLFDMIWLTKDAHYIFNHYTMFCTHREAFMQSLIESIGINIHSQADKYGLGAAAHIYNAPRQLGLGNLQWPDMDRLIKLHKVALFAGDPPTTPADMLKRFKHRYWGPNRAMSQKAKAKVMSRPATQMKPSALTQAFNVHWETCGRIPFWHSLKENVLAAATETKAVRKRATTKDTPVTKQRFVEDMPAMEEYLTEQLKDVHLDYHKIDIVSAVFYQRLHELGREVFEKMPDRVVPHMDVDRWSGIDFASEAFEQEAKFHELRAKAGGDPSKLPIQDCDYLLDSINCLANTLYTFGISRVRGEVAAEEGVNVPVHVRRFRLRGSEDMQTETG